MSFKEQRAVEMVKLLIERQTDEINRLRDEITQLNTALGIKNATSEQLKARVAELEPLAADRQQQYDMKVKARKQRDEMRRRVAELEAQKVSGTYPKPSVLKDRNVTYSTSTQQTSTSQDHPESVEVLGKTCIDGGTCHHACTTRCFRRECCWHFSDYEGPWAYPKEGDAQQSLARQVPEGLREILCDVWARVISSDEGFDLIEGMLAAAPQAEPDSDWIACSERKPPSGQTVLAFYLNTYGMERRIRAQHVDAWTIQADDLSDPDTECVEYSEQEDAYYLSAGWYECIDNWGDYSRIAVNEGIVTHWMPLPAAPTLLAEQAGGES